MENVLSAIRSLNPKFNRHFIHIGRNYVAAVFARQDEINSPRSLRDESSPPVAIIDLCINRSLIHISNDKY